MQNTHKELITEFKLLQELSVEARDNNLKNAYLKPYKEKYTSIIKQLSILIPELKNKLISEQAKKFLVVNERLRSIQKHIGLLTIFLIILFALLIQVYVLGNNIWLYVLTALGVVSTFILYRKVQQLSKLLHEDILTVDKASKKLVNLLKK